MKIKAKHLLIGGGILASIIALTSMSGSASTTNSSSGSGSGSGNNQRTGEEGAGLTNSTLEDKINNSADLQIKLEIAKLKGEIARLENDWRYWESEADIAHAQKKWDNYTNAHNKRTQLRGEIDGKKEQLKFFEQML